LLLPTTRGLPRSRRSTTSSDPSGTPATGRHTVRPWPPIAPELPCSGLPGHANGRRVPDVDHEQTPTEAGHKRMVPLQRQACSIGLADPSQPLEAWTAASHRRCTTPPVRVERLSDSAAHGRCRSGTRGRAPPDALRSRRGKRRQARPARNTLKWATLGPRLPETAIPGRFPPHSKSPPAPAPSDWRSR